MNEKRNLLCFKCCKVTKHIEGKCLECGMDINRVCRNTIEFLHGGRVVSLSCELPKGHNGNHVTWMPPANKGKSVEIEWR